MLNPYKKWYNACTKAGWPTTTAAWMESRQNLFKISNDATQAQVRARISRHYFYKTWPTEE